MPCTIPWAVEQNCEDQLAAPQNNVQSIHTLKLKSIRLPYKTSGCGWTHNFQGFVGTKTAVVMSVARIGNDHPASASAFDPVSRGKHVTVGGQIYSPTVKKLEVHVYAFCSHLSNKQEMISAQNRRAVVRGRPSSCPKTKMKKPWFYWILSFIVCVFCFPKMWKCLHIIYSYSIVHAFFTRL